MARGFVRYQSYMFRDKDPIIDVLRTAVSESGMKYTEVQKNGGPTANTLSNWFNGRTRRPQFATVAATARTLGAKAISFGSNSGRPKLLLD